MRVNSGAITLRHTWLPHSAGGFTAPKELRLDQLPPEFCRDESLAQALGMKSSSLVALAKEAGVPPGILEYFAHPGALAEFEEFKRWRKERKPKPKRPEAPCVTPDGAKSESPSRLRSPRRSNARSVIEACGVNWATKDEARTTLRELNTNEDGQMICQICGEEMPFKLDNGTYFFEAVECVRGLNRELPQNYIALCPVCAAMYQHANGTPPGELKQRILAADGLEVPVTLAREQCTIVFTRFTGIDLQSALQAIAG